MAQSWNWWTSAKLEVLEKYLHAFTMASSKKAPQTVYLDAFAGDDININRDSNEEFAGSARLALSTQPPFTALRYFERPRRAQRLHQSLTAEYPDRDIKVVGGDCNQGIPGVLAELRQQGRQWWPTFAFVDPYGMQVNWSTLEALATHKKGRYKVELWMLFATAGLQRVLSLRRPPSEANRDLATRVYGTEDWLQIHALRSANRISGTLAREEYVNLMRWRLEQGLGYRYTHSFHVRNEDDLSLYHMIFATDNDTGHKIMGDLYADFAARFPQMQRQATERREDEMGLIRLFEWDEPAAGELYVHQPPWTPPGPA